jgi:hypothetical protein
MALGAISNSSVQGSSEFLAKNSEIPFQKIL